MDLAVRALNLGLGAARLGVKISFGVLRTVAHVVGLDGAEPAAETGRPPEYRRKQPAPARPAPVRVSSEAPVEAPSEDFVEVDAEPEPESSRPPEAESEPTHIDTEVELVGEFAEPG